MYNHLHANADRLRLYNLHQCGEKWMLNLASHPAVTNIVAQHCGSDFYFYLSHVISKEPRSTYAVPWHQDYRTKGDMRHCSIWIALDAVDENNGCVACVPGAHELPMETCDLGCIDFTSVVVHNELDSKALPLTMSAGQASILHPLMPHHSSENKSDRWRRALVLRFASAQCHVIQEQKTGKVVEQQQEYYPAVFKDGSWFADYRTGEVFEGISLLHRCCES